MSALRSKTVLISEPQVMELGPLYLPYMWGVLKSYWQHHGDSVDAIEWLDPIYRNGKASALLQPYQDLTIDVLGLSCYTWNWHLQRRLAQQVKTYHPDCVVVAGGPDPDFKDPDFFHKHPYIDMIAVKDGEITFTNVLKKILAEDREFTDIGGLYLPNPGGTMPTYTGPPEVPVVFDYSPYLEQSDYYDRLRRSLNTDCFAVWETNRGCPYSCSFCDWGSNTMSKIRQFDMERLRAEIDWLGRTKTTFIMLVDANFGILPRDVEIADLVVAAHEKYGYPMFFTHSNAKNNPDRTVAIAKKFTASGLSRAHILSIQHTHKEVLAATDRANISSAKQIEVVRQLMHDDVPIYVQLILGIPGDKYAWWKACFADLMEWGIHSYYWVFPYHLLPNAPAANPDYVKKWQIETIDRYVDLSNGIRLKIPLDEERTNKSKLIIKTKTYSQSDWIRMMRYASFIKAFHNCSVTQSIAIYLRFTHGIMYGEFYDNLIENFCTQFHPADMWSVDVLEHYKSFLKNEDGIAYMDIDQIPSFQYQIEPSRWLFVQLCLHIDRFFEALKPFLMTQYPAAATNLESVIDYQKNLIILPDYDRDRGKSFSTECDWVSYFAHTRRLITYQPLPEPDRTPGAIVQVHDQTGSDEGLTFPLDWGLGSQEERWIKWIQSTVVGRNSPAKNNFQQLRLHRSTDYQAAGQLGPE